jgi:RNA polymerase sigma factor (sigma-70 family)
MQLQFHLQQLPPRARAVIVLRYFEDLDVNEVATILAITPSAVRVASSRALARLKILVTQEDAP